MYPQTNGSYLSSSTVQAIVQRCTIIAPISEVASEGLFGCAQSTRLAFTFHRNSHSFNSLCCLSLLHSSTSLIFQYPIIICINVRMYVLRGRDCLLCPCADIFCTQRLQLSQTIAHKEIIPSHCMICNSQTEYAYMYAEYGCCCIQYIIQIDSF